jgi:hypothetical protein
LEKVEKNVKEENDKHRYIQPILVVFSGRSERCVKGVRYYEVYGTHDYNYIEYLFPGGVLFDHQSIKIFSESVYILVGDHHIFNHTELFKQIWLISFF